MLEFVDWKTAHLASTVPLPSCVVARFSAPLYRRCWNELARCQDRWCLIVHGKRLREPPGNGPGQFMYEFQFGIHALAWAKH